MLRYLLGGDVRDVAKKRIRWLYDEFEGRVAVSMSGGKDSTVLFHLTREVADELGVEKVPVMWLDQELEYAATVDYMRSIMYREDVDPYWLQVPFDLANNTSHDPEHQWLHVWGEGEEWIRERDPIAITENVYGSRRFKELLNNATGHHFPDHAMLVGIRVEESPSRLLGMTTYYPAHKWATWGTKYPTHRNMAPLYDWSFRDIWRAIHDGQWPYNAHYDAQYRYGVRLTDMRVSNFHHEQSARNLFMLQELEPDTWAKATMRLAGISTAGTLGADDYMVYELPFMFTTWEQYRDHLLNTLIAPEQRESYATKFAEMEVRMPVTMSDPKGRLRMVKQQCRSLIANDYEFVQLTAAIISRPRELREADVAANRAKRAAKKEAV